MKKVGKLRPCIKTTDASSQLSFWIDFLFFATFDYIHIRTLYYTLCISCAFLKYRILGWVFFGILKVGWLWVTLILEDFMFIKKKPHTGGWDFIYDENLFICTVFLSSIKQIWKKNYKTATPDFLLCDYNMNYFFMPINCYIMLMIKFH